MNARFEELVGKTLVGADGLEVGSEELILRFSDFSVYKLWHNQDCCEGVDIQDICGDLNDLIGEPLVVAEQAESGDRWEGLPEYGDSWTWTFYRLATRKGMVVIRWLGQSNGYYSESVDFERLSSDAEEAKARAEWMEMRLPKSSPPSGRARL